jgi:deferrochelatase/peroxidase EfeB
MHAAEDFDSITAPIHGAQCGLQVRAVFGQVATLHLEDDGAAGTGREIPIHTHVLDASPKLRNTGGDVSLYLKTPDHATAERLMAPLLPALEKLAEELDIVVVGKREDGRIMGGRYLDGITNPSGPASRPEDILIAGAQAGACLGFTRSFVFDWPSITSMAPDSQDEMPGRDPHGTILPRHVKRSRVHRAHVVDGAGNNRKLLREVLPFGAQDGHAGREATLMFVACCNEQPRFEEVLQHMTGRPGCNGNHAARTRGLH